MIALVPQGVDPLWMALTLSRVDRDFSSTVAIANELLNKNPRDQAALLLKMQALTLPHVVDEVELEDTATDAALSAAIDDTATAQQPSLRPGTSLRVAASTENTGGPTSRAMRPVTGATGKPVTGFVRPQVSRGGESLDQAIRTARATARPATATTGRFVRLGTASLLGANIGGESSSDLLGRAYGDAAKLASQTFLNRTVFELLLHRDGDVRRAFDLASAALSASSSSADWYWHVQVAKCYLRLGLLREAERELRLVLVDEMDSASSDQRQRIIGPPPTDEARLLLLRILCRMDQPTAALRTIDQALSFRPNNVRLLTAAARIHEGLGDLEHSADLFTRVLEGDATNVEAISTLATHKFYSEQPEQALRLFRRLLQAGHGITSPELMNNVALCCFYAGYHSLSLACFNRAIGLASTDVDAADVWYNVSHLAVGLGDIPLAQRCLRLALAYVPDHPEALTNLGVLEMSKGYDQTAKSKSIEIARACFHAARTVANHLYEPAFNMASLGEQTGDLQTAFQAVSSAVAAFADQPDANRLLADLRKIIASNSDILSDAFSGG